jgi:hypothetical protein
MGAVTCTRNAWNRAIQLQYRYAETVKLVDGEEPYSSPLLRLQACQGRDMKEKLAESAQD